MYYDAEMRILCSTFSKCHIKTSLLNTDEDVLKKVDLQSFYGSLFKEGENFNFTVEDIVSPVKHAHVYKFTDSFLFNYIFFLLPGTENKIFMIGPFVSDILTNEQIMGWLEKHSVAAADQKIVSDYFSAVPILKSGSHLFVLLEAFFESIWGVGGYNVDEISKDLSNNLFPVFNSGDFSEKDNTLLKMQVMEKRYSFENELIDAVENGNVNKAEQLFSKLNEMSFEIRLSDRLRNIKNYCIISNTLLRKAVEKGGVHPIYIDSISSDFAMRIEKGNSVSVLKALIAEMFRSYCRLVRKYSMRQYSPSVQKVIALIDADLTADLSLKALSSALNLNPSYLSALFKRETGSTLTDFVNKRRIKKSMYLLKTTKIQVQTAAQYCGIDDVHYFAKLFKRNTGMTPKEYRKNNS